MASLAVTVTGICGFDCHNKWNLFKELQRKMFSNISAEQFLFFIRYEAFGLTRDVKWW